MPVSGRVFRFASRRLEPVSTGARCWLKEWLEMPKLTVRVDPTLCITAANCSGIAPDLFHINEEGIAEVKDRSGVPQGYECTLDATEVEAVLIDEAVESCPAGAISVEPST